MKLVLRFFRAYLTLENRLTIEIAFVSPYVCDFGGLNAVVFMIVFSRFNGHEIAFL